MTATSQRLPVVFLPHGGGPWPFVKLGFGSDAEQASLAGYLRAVRDVPKTAPRALLDTAGYNDVWSNPRGAYRTNQAAKPVFEMLGVPGNIAFHIRPGGHEHNMVDYVALLDYADEVLFQKKSGSDWNVGPKP